MDRRSRREMTYSYTTTDTFTRTHAVYLASKVAADLQQMQAFYGEPSDGDIDKYLEELIILLVNRCLNMVEYGFRRGNTWVVVTRYTVRADGVSIADDRSGRIPAGANVSGASWYSFLEYGEKWQQLSENQRQQIRKLLPFQRTTGTEPGIDAGGWTYDKTYSKNGVSLERGVYRA